MNMDMLKQQQNRGYLIAGIGAVIAFIAFFLPYFTASYSFGAVSGSSSAGGASTYGWIWFEFIAVLVAIAVSGILIFRNNALSGVINMPVEKQILYGRYTLIGAGVLALLIHILFAFNIPHAAFQGLGYSYSYGLGFGWWVFLIASIAIIVGGVLAYRTPMPAVSQPQSWQYPQSTQYPPYQQPQQPYPPQPPYQQPYPPTEQPPQQYPPQQYPPQPPQQNPPQQNPSQW
jgi:hypothetical protein